MLYYFQRRQADAAITGDYRGNALRYLERDIGSFKHGQVIMGMAVDESRRQHESGGVQTCIRLPMSAVAQVDNPVAVDGNVDIAGHPATTIDDSGPRY